MTTTHEYVQMVKTRIDEQLKLAFLGKPERVYFTVSEYEAWGIKFRDETLHFPDGHMEVERTVKLPPASMVFDVDLHLEV